MRIGIDVSQLAYENTGVAQYLSNLVKTMVHVDNNNDYVLFFSSLRKKFPLTDLPKNCKVKKFKFPLSFLNLLWNKLHIFPIESLLGDVDVFITSDWTEPPTKKAKKATILYDLIVYKYPEETHSKTKLNLFRLNILPNIVDTQRRKLKWVKKESDIVFCISEATKKDAIDLLKISENKLNVIYPGLSL
jgi:hypothetical protein